MRRWLSTKKTMNKNLAPSNVTVKIWISLFQALSELRKPAWRVLTPAWTKNHQKHREFIALQTKTFLESSLKKTHMEFSLLENAWKKAGQDPPPVLEQHQIVSSQTHSFPFSQISNGHCNNLSKGPSNKWAVLILTRLKRNQKSIQPEEDRMRKTEGVWLQALGRPKWDWLGWEMPRQWMILNEWW